MSGSEFSRIIDIRQIAPGETRWSADADECRRLAGRFALSAIDRFEARLVLVADGAVVRAQGRIGADLVQACAVSGEDFPVRIDEPVDLRFVPATTDVPADEEIELSADDCDEIGYTGLSFDLGEALAQSLALAIDPFAEGPNADRARAEHNLAGDGASGAFAALAALTGKTGA